MVAPNTAAGVRHQAGQFLQQAMISPDTWDIFAEWLGKSVQHLDEHQAKGQTAVSTLLLLQQLLQKKIRRQLSNSNNMHPTPPSIMIIHQQLLDLASKPSLDKDLRSSTSMTLAALTVRSALMLQESIRGALSGESMPPIIALQFLANVPLEAERKNLRLTEIMEALGPYLKIVLETTGQLLTQPNSDLLPGALKTLHSWIKVCHVNVSQLLQVVIYQTSLLHLLIGLLSHSETEIENVLTNASQALSESVRQPSDEGTNIRNAALQMLLGSIEQGFLRIPISLATEHEWEDACLALTELVCTIVTESVDDFVTQPAEALLRLLLELQAHPSIKVRINMLEVWLTVQEIPVGQRHENWGVTLFRHVMQVIVHSVAYPQDFINWEESLDDSSEFDEYRRLCQDVLTSSYILLRHEFVTSQVNAATNQASSWTTQEAAIFALISIAKDVRARIKSHVGPRSIVTDREETTRHLLILVRFFCVQEKVANDAAFRHTHLLVTIIEFVGAYAEVWQRACSLQESIGLLVFAETILRSCKTYSAIPSARAIRSLLINMDASSVINAEDQQTGRLGMLELIQKLMSAASFDTEALAIVTEGCTRFVASSNDQAFICQGLGQMAESVLNHAHFIIQRFPAGVPATAYDTAAVEDLVSFMQSLQVIIRFGDNGSTDASKHEMEEIVQLILPFLQTLTPLFLHELVLENGLTLHEQLLQNFSEPMAKHLDQMVMHIFELFRQSAHPRALTYFSTAVELYGHSRPDLFGGLFSTLSSMIFTRLNTAEQLLESTEVIHAFFGLSDRYVIYCSGGLLSSYELPSVVRNAVLCLTVLQGEKEATRSNLNFLSKLFGWQSLRLSAQSNFCLAQAARQLDELLMTHGARITQVCLEILLGGPQMLYPACSDCLFSILKSASTLEEPDGLGSTVAQHWLNSTIDKELLKNPVYDEMMSMLLQMIHENNKPRAKLLLTDLSKIHRGEIELKSVQHQ